VLPPDVVERSEIRYRASTIASPGMLRDLRAAASEAVQAERLQRAGLDGGAVAELVRRVDVDNARITGEGEERGDALSTFLVAYMLAFVIYFVVTIYGVGVLRSVLEEKTNRISEVLVSSMRSGHLMAGKILGVGAAALVQVTIWGLALALLTRSEALAARAGLPPGALQALSLDAGTAFAFLGFFVLGFLVFAALFAALGAAVTSEQEAQSFQMILLLPLIVPLLFLVPLTSEPLGPLATALGLFPLTSPIAMPMRMASAAVPLWQTLAALALLAVALLGVAWLAGRVYRIGILSTGKRPTLRELGRWLKMA
jgi:ABC-2 type transport system permease protein